MSNVERVWVRRLLIASVVGLVWAFVVPRGILVVAERGWFVRFQPGYPELDTVKQFGLHYQMVVWHDPVMNADGSWVAAYSDTRLQLGWPFSTFDTKAVVVEPVPKPNQLTIRPNYSQPSALEGHMSEFNVDPVGAIGNSFTAFVGTMVLVVVGRPVCGVLMRRKPPVGYCVCGYELCGLRAGACCPECGRENSSRRLRVA